VIVDSTPNVAQGLWLILVHLDEQLQVQSEGCGLNRYIKFVGVRVAAVAIAEDHVVALCQE
jgi:hypothetical protein